MKVDITVGPTTSTLMAYATTAIAENDYPHACLALLALRAQLGRWRTVQAIRRMLDHDLSAIVVRVRDEFPPVMKESAATCQTARNVITGQHL